MNNEMTDRLPIVEIRRRVDRWGAESYQVFLNRALKNRMSVNQTFKGEKAYEKAHAFAFEKEKQAQKIATQIEMEEEIERAIRDERDRIVRRIRTALNLPEPIFFKWSDNLIPLERLTTQSKTNIENLRFAFDKTDYDVLTETGLYRVRLYFGGFPEVAKIEQNQ